MSSTHPPPKISENLNPFYKIDLDFQIDLEGETHLKAVIAGPLILANRPKFLWMPCIQSNFYRFKKRLVIDQFSFSSFSLVFIGNHQSANLV